MGGVSGPAPAEAGGPAGALAAGMAPRGSVRSFGDGAAGSDARRADTRAPSGGGNAPSVSGHGRVSKRRSRGRQAEGVNVLASRTVSAFTIMREGGEDLIGRLDPPIGPTDC